MAYVKKLILTNVLEMHIKALVELCLQHKASSSDFYLLFGLSDFFSHY